VLEIASELAWPWTCLEYVACNAFRPCTGPPAPPSLLFWSNGFTRFFALGGSPWCSPSRPFPPPVLRLPLKVSARFIFFCLCPLLPLFWFQSRNHRDVSRTSLKIPFFQMCSLLLFSLPSRAGLTCRVGRRTGSPFH